MQGELRLHEDVGGGSFPRQAFADQVAVFAVEIEVRWADAGCAVVAARMEELHAIDAELVGVEDAADRFVPVAPRSFRACPLNDLGKADACLDRFQGTGWRPCVERCRRHLRERGHHRVEHFAVEIQRESGEGGDEQEQPRPQAAGAVQVAQYLARHIHQKSQRRAPKPDQAPMVVTPQCGVQVKRGVFVLGLFRAVPQPQGLQALFTALQHLGVAQQPFSQHGGEVLVGSGHGQGVAGVLSNEELALLFDGQRPQVAQPLVLQVVPS